MPEAGAARIGWAIIGTGLVADKFIAPALTQLPSSTLIGVTSRTRSGADDFAARHGGVKVYGDLAELLADPDVQAVYIATPNGLHPDEVQACAEAGRQVLCDKPLALNVADAQRAMQACEKAGVQLGMMFQARAYDGIRKARELVAQRSIGDVRIAHIEIGAGMPGLRGWRTDPALAGMGATNNVGVHALDAVSFVLGESPIEVTAMTSASEPGGLETTAVVMLRYPSGAIATASIAQSVTKPRYDLTLFGTSGRIDGHDVTFADRLGRVELISEAPQSFEVSSQGAHATILGEFIEAIRTGTPFSPSGADGLESVRLVEAIATAASTGTVVSL
jgi:1,5-anhydro-D-fructose reductase (1,5-anhydro-D-mannitol-forming)